MALFPNNGRGVVTTRTRLGTRILSGDADQKQDDKTQQSEDVEYLDWAGVFWLSLADEGSA